MAFSASKGLPFEWCRSPDVGLPAPDLTLFLDISPEKAKERGGYGEERYEKEEIQKRVRTIFSSIAQETREKEKWKWVSIDAGRELEAVTEEIWHEVQPFVTEEGPQEVGKLWAWKEL